MMDIVENDGLVIVRWVTEINKRKQTYRFTVKLHVHNEDVCALFLP